MSRRVLVPILLLVSAAACVAAVFAVQDVESRVGPLSEPYATPFISPDGDGTLDAAEIHFNARERARLSVFVVDEGGARVRTLLRGSERAGPVELRWDGTDDEGEPLPDGAYRVVVQRAGDRREYGPPRPVRIDREPPVGALDRLAVVDGELRGLVQAEPDGRLVATFDDRELPGMRAWRPRPGSDSAELLGRELDGTVRVRFTQPLPSAQPVGTVCLTLVDRAGNATALGGARLAGQAPTRVDCA